MSVDSFEMEEYYAKSKPKRRCHKLFPNCRTCDDVNCWRWSGDEDESDDEEEGEDE